jgi:hypothetical protein
MDPVIKSPDKSRLTVSVSDSHIVFFQESVPLANIDKSTGKIGGQISSTQFTSEYQVQHIVGVIKLLKGKRIFILTRQFILFILTYSFLGSYLIIATECDMVETILNHNVYRIIDVELLSLNMEQETLNVLSLSILSYIIYLISCDLF